MDSVQRVEQVVYLIPDDDTTGRKRIDQIRSAGANVETFAFRRNHKKAYALPTDASIHGIGVLPKRRYFARISALASALFSLVGERQRFRSADLIIARNLDLLLLAIAAKVLAGSRTRIVYEIHDIPLPVQGNGVRARLFRAVERIALRQVSFMVLTSQAFVDNYYKRYFAFSIPYQILENKIYLESFFRAAPAKMAQWTSKARTKPDFDPSHIRLSWVGGLRCARSAGALRDVAKQVGNKVEIHIHGRANFCTESELQEFFADTPNVTYHGTFEYPDDLIDIYRIDLNWCFDFSDVGQNTRWLLPNRIYEGGYFGVPSLAERNTATGDNVEAAGTGWTFVREQLVEQVSQFLMTLNVDTYMPVKRRCVELMDERSDSHHGVAAILERAAVAA